MLNFDQRSFLKLREIEDAVFDAANQIVPNLELVEAKTTGTELHLQILSHRSNVLSTQHIKNIIEVAHKAICRVEHTPTLAFELLAATAFVNVAGCGDSVIVSFTIEPLRNHPVWN
jgi:hypothetical protein